jgi:hypothetical protein
VGTLYRFALRHHEVGPPPRLTRPEYLLIVYTSTSVVREINAINQKELELGLTASWHDDYKDSARIFVGGLSKDLSEGDVITILSQ